LKLTNDGTIIGPDITLKAEVYNLVPDLASFEAPDFAGSENSICGFLIILVAQAFDIPIPRTYANISVKVAWGRQHNFVTPSVVNASGIDPTNPSFDTPFLVPLTQELVATNKDQEVVFTVMNSNDVVGTTRVAYASIADEPTKTVSAQKDTVGEGAALRYQVSLRGLSSS